MLHCYMLHVHRTMHSKAQLNVTLLHIHLHSVTCTLNNAQRGPIECYPLQNKKERWSAREHLRTDAVLTQPRLHTRALKIDDPLFGHKL